jgi:hypothetical protein
LLSLYRPQPRIQPTASDYFECPDEHTSVESALIIEERKSQVRRVLEQGVPLEDVQRVQGE